MRDYIHVASKPRKPLGRRPLVDAQTADDMRETFKRNKPNGEPYKYPDIARLYRISIPTAIAVISRTGVYAEKKT